MNSDRRLNWMIATMITGWLLYLLALPAAAVLSVLVRFAYDRYLKEQP
ncbi:MAG: hypothetical protein IIB77_13105 [Proteobacteria bacterium]|nr:hypothetical protein [Pseudomonadota bacterium]